MNKKSIIEEIWYKLSCPSVQRGTWGGTIMELYLSDPYPGDRFRIVVNAAYSTYPNKEVHIYMMADTEGVISFCSAEVTKAAITTGIEKLFPAMDSYWDDAALETAWGHLCDICTDVDDCIVEPFLHFDAGTPCKDVWSWFNRLYSEGVQPLADQWLNNEDAITEEC